jgi:hypothetical protein
MTTTKDAYLVCIHTIVWLSAHIGGSLRWAASFEWDFDKDAENQREHGLSFSLAQQAFADPKLVVARDPAHSGSQGRKGRRVYEQANQVFQ